MKVSYGDHDEFKEFIVHSGDEEEGLLEDDKH